MVDIYALDIYFRQNKVSPILTAILKQSFISEQDSKCGEKITEGLHKSGKERKGEGQGRPGKPSLVGEI